MASYRDSDDPTQQRQPAQAQRARLLVHWDGGFISRDLPSEGQLVFGRAKDCEVSIDDASVSRRHARLTFGAVWTVEDLGSSNGTRVAGTTLRPNVPVPIRSGDPLEIGSVRVLFDAPAATPTRPPPAPAPSQSVPTAFGGAYRLVELAARAPLPVLLTGETGVGKEIAAQAIQRLSSRASGPFLRVNCAALSETLIDSELFGHERGAFTGAQQAKPGLIEAAHGGTLFLDEVGELPMATQAKLLRVIESGEVTRVGSVSPRTVDVRFIAATNRDLVARVTEGAFRQDLLFRLNAVTIAIPPLRERPEEIPALVATFSAEAARRLQKPAPSIDPRAMALLSSYKWPGNVRELRHVIERAVFLFQADPIGVDHLPPEITAGSAPAPSAQSNVPAPSSDLDPEHQRILDALAQAAGHQGRAAEILGISRRTLVDRLDAFGVARPRKGQAPPKR
ncbi:MAG: sigma 54-interacting transcriptional regulator [Polyangiaceae bacterium]|nr:sigma 54-interacting transcriptional regulator [Polyangiaceae bacterium]